ncbi:MAG: bifunctional folylpolyglutamate synthase/dihydrofolate synthase [Oscillospiraceae bacterium]|jgi:dihydrofolate synthase/folylpolyglutamate synthase|nr:bifunctional folylpolyglutamate synthase/dihydrofolate synthase [Oscillospiraceae bacterium]
MSITSTLEYIHSVKWQGAKPGLSRTRELLAKLGNPENALKFIHVAGTNGKGSTAAMLASVLQTAGYRVGLYTSPYILRFNERMQADGAMITDAELESLTDELRPFADAMDDAPTEFELITALALLFFLRKKCDVVVLEVGMGGELDSTNVIPTPDLAVITAIGLDHTAELGGTVAQIASAKAGIIKPGGLVAVYGEDADSLRVFEAKCAEVGAALVKTDFTRLRVRELTLGGATLDMMPYLGVRLPLAGAYQPRNAALAVTALEALRKRGWAITDAHIQAGLAAVRWPGRFEVLRRKPDFILDGAHNPHGIHAAAESFRALFGERKLIFLVGVMADKDVPGMMAELIPFAERFIAVTPRNPRAMDAEKLASLLAEMGARTETADSVEAGVIRAVNLAGRDGGAVALGSLYFSGDVREAVEKLT